MRFLSPEVALYLYKFTIQPCMEYCCHVEAWGCFPYTYDLNGFKPKINRRFNCRFFLNRSPVCFNIFVLLLLLVSPFLQAPSEDSQYACGKMHTSIWLGKWWCVMCNFLRFNNLLKVILHIYIVFLKKLRPLFSHLTY